MILRLQDSKITRLILYFFIISLVINKLAYGQQEIWAKITAGATRQRISLAIPNFALPVNCPNDLITKASDIRQITIDDLEFSLFFEITKLDSTKNYSIADKKVDFVSWFSTDAQVLIAVDVQIKNKPILNVHIYDLFTRRLIGTKNYDLENESRWLAHRFADDVIKLLTGENGVSQTKIVFSLKKGTAKELATIDYDGYNLNQITNSGELKLFPSWTSNANKIAYCSYAKSNLNIYTYDLNRKAVDLICGKDGLNTTPEFSPDGKNIAASLTINGNPNIYILSADGKKINQITFGRAIDISPTWSPSGRELAFVSDRTGSPQIYVINVDGTNLRRLTFEGSYNTSPAWSPRGDLIAYVARESDGKNQIYVTDLTGSNRMHLTNLRNNEEPTWSSDGLHIAFSSNRSGTYEIYLMHWNGTGQRQITHTNGAFSPSWSPRLAQ
jgi:TolB protein